MISGLSHITLIVENLEKSSRFLRDIFDAKEVYSSGERQFSLSEEKFFLIGELWVCLMQGQSPAERTYNHIAFKVSESDFDAYRFKTEALGIDIKPERPRVKGEGRSLYFYDFDNHLFEIHTGTLSERLKTYSDRI
jgi:catechol 2,3-dioxygenase-like lactoylglutathione lyase family enzyme